MQLMKYSLLSFFIVLLFSACYEDVEDLSNNGFDDDAETAYFKITGHDYDGWSLHLFFDTVEPIPSDYDQSTLQIALIRDEELSKVFPLGTTKYSTGSFNPSRRTCFQIAYVRFNNQTEYSNPTTKYCLGN
ncbi:MAG: hypothetical protein AB8F74_22770 [Saprospiraceae bacterium]